MVTGPRQAHRLWLAAILLGTFLVYVPSLGNDYTYDARHYAMGITPDGVPNYMVGELRPITEYFRRPMQYRAPGQGRGFRPITVLSYALMYNIFKPEAPAWPSHLLDVLLHVLATWLAYLLVAELCGRGPPALVAAAVFGFHALRSDVVLSIVGRAEILAFVFGSTGVLLYVRSMRLVAMVSLFLAFCSKESAVAWSIFLPLYAWARHVQRRDQKPFPLRTMAVDWLWVCLLPLVVFLTLRGLMLAEHVKEEFLVGYRQNPLHHVGDAGKVFATAVMMLGYGLYKCFLPIHLACDYGAHVFPIVGLFDYRFLLAALVLVGILVGGLWVARREPVLFLAMAVFLGFAFLTSNIAILVEANFAERFYYTPASGLSFLAAFVAGVLRPGWVRKVALAVLVVWLAVGGSLCVKRCLDWRDNDTLFQTDVKAQPRSVSLRVYLSGVARRQGNMAEWRYQLEKALEIDPRSPDPLNSMGAWYIANDNPKKAIDYLNQAMQSPYYHPHTHGGFVHENLGYAYIALDKIPEAERELTKAVELNPHQFTAVRTLLELAVMRKDTAALADRLRRARWLFPEPNAVLDMYEGLAASWAGDHVRAEQLLGRALMALDRAPVEAGGIRPLAWGWHALARSLVFLGRAGESVQIVKRFLQMPNLPAAERQMFVQLAQELQGRGR